MNTLSQTMKQTDPTIENAETFSAQGFSSRKLWEFIDEINPNSEADALQRRIAASHELIRRNEYSEESYFYSTNSTNSTNSA